MVRLIPLTLFFALLPDNAFAWGPMTHAYLAGEILRLSSLLPNEISLVITTYRQDFLYGNLIADMFIGKKYLPAGSHFHNWQWASRLLSQASTPSEKSFAYGVMCHLAADTVAHRILIKEKLDLKHAWIEFVADSIISRSLRLNSVAIKRTVQVRNDAFLKKAIPTLPPSFNTHKALFKGVVLLSALSKKKIEGLDRQYLENLHRLSVWRMLDVLINGGDSKVLQIDPSS